MTGWDGWMASPTQCRWVWIDFWSWWWKGRPHMLWSMVSQRVRHNWATELLTDWTTTIRTFAICPVDIELCAAAAANFQYPMMWIQGGKWGTLFKEAMEQVCRQPNIISRGWFHNPSLCISSHLEHQVLVTSRKLLQCKCLTSLNYPFTKILQVDLPTLPLWSSLSELSEVLSPRVQSSFCPRIKFNSHLSHRAFFFQSTQSTTVMILI